jgi:L-fuculose-phosphate aldolase
MARLLVERAAVVAACRRLAASGLVQATAGNVSARAGDLIAITPTGARFERMTPADVTVVDRSGRVVEGPLAPSSELAIHLAVYERYGSGAVVHAHPVTATALSCVIDELPCVHEALVALGGPIRVAAYATFGTPALAQAAVAALEDRRAALLANHGTVTHGDDLDSAVQATELLEWGSEVYWRARAIGVPRVLDAQARAVALEAAATRGYGTTRPVDG